VLGRTFRVLVVDIMLLTATAVMMMVMTMTMLVMFLVHITEIVVILVGLFGRLCLVGACFRRRHRGRRGLSFRFECEILLLNDLQLEYVLVLDAHLGAVRGRTRGQLEEIGQVDVVERVFGDTIKAVLNGLARDHA
jgi:hypothetical protein